MGNGYFLEKLGEMITDTQRRNQILRKINRIPLDRLKELDDFVSKLEQGIIQKNKALSFAGAWSDIDESVFTDLTDDLINNRPRNGSDN
jgi:hypothetical protein